ncbi:MAG: hypothetical protein FWC09_10065 [Lachnospiraceae bacterium]|nr:hypothetical protein [Lachnospiraceae bacterium]
MNKVKKILSLVLVLVLTTSLLTACGGGSDKRGETVTLTVYSQLANYNGEMIGWFAQLMLEKFNVKILIVSDEDGVYETRMEAQNLGDIIIWGNDGDQYIRAFKQGLLWDWDDEDLLVEYGPYINEHMQPALGKNRGISERETGSPDLFGFGHRVAADATEIGSFMYSWDLRWDLYEAVGHPPMRNLKEFADVLEMMRDYEEVDNIGNPIYAASLWSEWDGTMVMYAKSTATAYYGYDEFHMGLYDPEDGTFYPTLLENGPYISMLEFYNDLYRRNLLDPDSMTHTFNTMASKMENGGVLFSIFDYAGEQRYNTLDHMADNKIMLSFAPDEARPVNYGLNIYGMNRIWSIGAKTQYPELCMEIIDWLCTPEGRLTIDYGPKGITWDYDEDGNTYFTELGKRTDADRNIEMEDGYSGKFGDGSFQINNYTWDDMAINPESNEPYNKKFWRSYEQEPRNAAEADWREFTGANSVHEYMTSRPYVVALGTSYSENIKTTEFKSTWEQVCKAIRDYSWRAIYADTTDQFNDIIDELIEAAYAYGYEECVEWSLVEVEIRRAHEAQVRADNLK